jgi:molybdopterin biosynthesis enzyme MoaB
MSEAKLRAIEARIEGIKEALQGIGEMRPGSLTRQSRGAKGVYYQLSYTHKMKGRTEYVRPEYAPRIIKQISAYKRFKRLVEEWASLGIEHSRTKIELWKQGKDK